MSVKCSIPVLCFTRTKITTTNKMQRNTSEHVRCVSSLPLETRVRTVRLRIMSSAKLRVSSGLHGRTWRTRCVKRGQTIDARSHLTYMPLANQYCNRKLCVLY